MTDSGVNGGEADIPIPSPTPSFDPFFKMWSDWLSNSMGPMTTVPGVSLPWLAKPGVSTGEEAEPLPKGAMANDPLLSALDKIWSANPFSNIVPLDWAEITRSLQTLWMREVSDPQRAMRAAADYNQRLFKKSVEIWTDATLRLWGVQQEKEKEGRTSDPRFSAPEWDSNPFYAMLAAVYHTQNTQV
jgi:polyhydroxyalkanoate synthase